MCRSLLTLAAALVVLSARTAESREPPFEAVIASPEALVKSAPGGDISYPTTKLSRGAKVRVIRKDFGGWYLIEPPTGSHSWIPADTVERRAGNRGIVLVTTTDRIGSEIQPENIKARQRLLKGETVEILGEAELRTDRGLERMLKIRPPRGEYRYINIADVVPAPEEAGQPDPFEGSAGLRPEPDLFDANTKDAAGSTVGEEARSAALPTRAEEGVPTPKVEHQSPGTVSTTGVEPDAVSVEKLPPGTINAYERLGQIDTQFREMTGQPVAQWNLGSIREQYLALRDAPQLKEDGFQREVSRRLQAVARYEQQYSTFASIQQVIQATEARDEQLRQQYLANRQTVATPHTVMTRVSREPVAQPPQWPHAPQASSRAATPLPGSPQWSRTPVTQPPSPMPTQPLLPSPNATGLSGLPFQVPNRFDGAGVVQRSALSRPDVPRHVLVAPDGRVLTYLQAGPGINLDQFVGRSLGIHGQRAFRPELNADLLVVNRLAPVVLKP